jgi:hypothetical protein
VALAASGEAEKPPCYVERMKTAVLRPEMLSDDALLARVDELIARGRRLEAELIWHLAEVDARKLYAREACPSMHVYATSRLHLSDAEAYLRITVARVSRRFPVVLRMLADGRLHLSAIARLSPHLREDKAEALLARAVHRSKREIELLVAALAPKPDARSFMRRLPARRGVQESQKATTDGGELRPGGVPAAGELRPGRVPAAGELGPGGVAAAGVVNVAAFADAGVPGTGRDAGVAGATSAEAPRAGSVAPLSVGADGANEAVARYKVQFTADAELHDKIVRARALLRHQIPDGDLGAVVDRAMTLLVRELERARFGATEVPRKAAGETDATPSSRHVPAPIRRAVWARDDGQCAFRDRQGRRCPARERLEFHHEVPFARGGDHSEGNVSLRCSAHNAYQADLDFGAAFMADRRAAARSHGQALEAPAAGACFATG